MFRPRADPKKTGNRIDGECRAVALGWYTGRMVWAATAVGVIMALTAALGLCPHYRLAGIKTRRI